MIFLSTMLLLRIGLKTYVLILSCAAGVRLCSRSIPSGPSTGRAGYITDFTIVRSAIVLNVLFRVGVGYFSLLSVQTLRCSCSDAHCFNSLDILPSFGVNHSSSGKFVGSRACKCSHSMPYEN